MAQFIVIPPAIQDSLRKPKRQIECKSTDKPSFWRLFEIKKGHGNVVHELADWHSSVVIESVAPERDKRHSKRQNSQVHSAVVWAQWSRLQRLSAPALFWVSFCCCCCLFVCFSFICISWRLIILQYCSGFCHMVTWISHGFTGRCSPSWTPLPPPSTTHPAGSSQCTSPEHLSHASNLGWRTV